jgi:PIN domain nuclease of toxin-antitoxin system
MIVLDTSAVILWLNGAAGLSQSAVAAIDAAEKRVISAVSIWEIALKVKQGRLRMRISLDQLIDRLGQVDRVETVSVDAQAWLDSVLLDWGHRDPADRVIVALARHLDCPLVTSDRVIAQFYGKTVW